MNWSTYTFKVLKQVSESKPFNQINYNEHYLLFIILLLTRDRVNLNYNGGGFKGKKYPFITVFTYFCKFKY